MVSGEGEGKRAKPPGQYDQPNELSRETMSRSETQFERGHQSHDALDPGREGVGARLLPADAGVQCCAGKVR